jgi:arylsulfatase A-like enzyme
VSQKAPNPSGERPNVLFIFADQLGAHYLGCYGHPQVETPNLDRLAGESVRFTRAYTASPLCTPFRGTLFLGRYPVQTGIVRNQQRIPAGETTLADLFNKAGYLTSYVGKWHLSGPPQGTRWVPPTERGGFSDFIGWECGHRTHFDHELFEDDPDRPIPMPGHETDGLTRFACERLERHAAGERPFCMFVSYQAPHPVCDPPEPYRSLYTGGPLHYRPTVDFDARFTGYGRMSVDMGVRDWTERYFGEISQLDAAVGRVLGKVEDLGLRDSTVVVFTSDHGDMGGCHGLFEKSVAYEEATRIPLLVRLPGQWLGRTSDALFSSVDFLPTLLGLCGLPPAATAEGIDCAPLLHRRPSAEEREAIFITCRDWACIRRGSYKLTLNADGTEMRKLFRLDVDPFEQINRVEDPAERETVEALRGLFLDWLEDVRTRAGDTEAASRISPALRAPR